MRGFSKAARDAFNADKARRAAYWQQLTEYSFITPFSWTDKVINGVYRRNYPN